MTIDEEVDDQFADEILMHLVDDAIKQNRRLADLLAEQYNNVQELTGSLRQTARRLTHFRREVD
jgi:hypothetical protein